VIGVKDLSFSYQDGREILKAVEFSAEGGECTAILGNNGAGKSTLLKCLNRILSPKKGVVCVEGKDVGRLSRNGIAQCMAYVSQKSAGGRFTVFDAVLLGRRPHMRFEPGPEDIEIAERCLARLGLSSFSLRFLDELSGGELQKVMLARALAQEPRVLLLDEPTSSLDLKNQYEVLEMVKKIAGKEKIGVILVLHDLNLALRYCDKFLFVKNGEIFAWGGKEIMTPETIGAVYGVAVAVETVCGVPAVIPLPRG